MLLAALIAGVGLLAVAAPALAQPPPPSASEPTGPEEGISVDGTLRSGDAELAGVTVEALDSGGARVGEATSDAQGRWELTVPGPGTYTFRVDSESLPQGTEVQQGEVTREIAEDRLSAVIFRFGAEREGLGTSTAAQVLRLLVDGIRFGLVIGITAVGLSLIFGITGLTNFSHGELVTIGAVLA